MNNQNTQVAQRVPFSTLISSKTWQATIVNTLRDPDRASRFCASITSAVSTNPALQACTPHTVLSAALLGESLNLSPSPQLGQFYLVPFKNKAKYGRNGDLIKPETTDAQFVLGYKGYIQLALRSGQYKTLNVISVKKGELKHWDPLTEQADLELVEDEEEREKLPTIGYIALFEYLNGFRKTIYWSRSKMENHALKYSKGYAAKKGYTFWEKDFDAMAYKTMLRQLISKWGIMSIDMRQAVEEDLVAEQLEEQSFVEPAPAPAPTPAPAPDTAGDASDEVEELTLDDF